MFNPRIRRAALRGSLMLVAAATLAGCGDSLSTPASRTAATPRGAAAIGTVACHTGFVPVGRFQGVDWCAYNGTSDPQNNTFRPTNVQMTSAGLRLTAPRVGGKWTGAWVCTAGKYDGGKFRFGVRGQLDQLDPNVVFGMYLDDLGDSPEWHELDIEFALWGNPKGKRLQFVLWGNLPMSPVKDYREYSWLFSAYDTRHSIVWRPGVSAEFENAGGSWVTRSRLPGIPTRAMNACVILWYSTPKFKKGMTPVGPVSGRAPDAVVITQFARDPIR